MMRRTARGERMIRVASASSGPSVLPSQNLTLTGGFGPMNAVIIGSRIVAIALRPVRSRPPFVLGGRPSGSAVLSGRPPGSAVLSGRPPGSAVLSGRPPGSAVLSGRPPGSAVPEVVTGLPPARVSPAVPNPMTLGCGGATVPTTGLSRRTRRPDSTLGRWGPRSGTCSEGCDMGLFSREFIAVPDNAKGQLVFKWPDYNLRRYSRAIVDVDEMALFLNKGQVVGTIAPGQHQIDADELPFLGIFIDHATGDNAYRAELYFVGTREYPGQPFGGRVDDVKDPQTGTIVTLRVFGEYSIKVTDPVALVTNLTGTVDVTNNDSITNWVGNQLLKVMRTEVTRQILGNGWPVLSLSAYTPDIEQTVINGGHA